ncbi:hypothetical protein VTO42DRAFT_4845 [Malbranchea cinnamomea]
MGLPKEWITDRDSKFTSQFWNTLMEQLGVKQKLSTAGHPQTDGQAERLNQTVEQYLRCYLNYQQDNWVSLPPLAQIAYNSSKNTTTGVTPFFANYGREPEIERSPLEVTHRSHEGQISAQRLKDVHCLLRLDIEFLNERMRHYYDNRRQGAPLFEEGEKVFLLRRNIKTKRPSEKLDHKKLGPFKILRKVGTLNYELELPRTMRIHPIFHVSLLEKADQNVKSPRVEIETDEQEYKVERILDRRRINRKIHYLVKWKGYPTSENTWETIEHLQNAREMVQQYHHRQPKDHQSKDQEQEKTRTRGQQYHAPPYYKHDRTRIVVACEEKNVAASYQQEQTQQRAIFDEGLQYSLEYAEIQNLEPADWMPLAPLLYAGHSTPYR